MGRFGRLTFTQIAVLIVVVVLVVVMLLLREPFHGESAERIRCRNNLNRLAMGMHTYLHEYGGERWYSFPLGRGLRKYDFNGAEWLASLYWTGVVDDPTVYICPASGDTNRGGRDLGTRYAIPGRFGPRTVSYAGMHCYSLTDTSGNPKAAAIPHDFSAEEPMACDDTEGTINHGEADNGVTSVLFFDSHVESWSSTRIDLEHGVGMRGGPLWRLRN